MTRARRKPGSVFDNHLSRHTVTGMLQRPTFRAAAGNCPALADSPFGLAPDGVYTRRMLPYIPVSSYLTISPLPLEAAVCFCCTFPIVTYAGRYPASSPCGARTFLTLLLQRAIVCLTRIPMNFKLHANYKVYGFVFASDIITSTSSPLSRAIFLICAAMFSVKIFSVP